MRRRFVWAVYAAIAGVFLLASFRLLAIVDHYAVDVLFWDQWDLLDAFLQGSSAWELFRWQHGPHRQGVGFWLTSIVMSGSAWSSRAEAFAIAGVVIVAAGLAVLLRYRLFGRLEWMDVAIPLVFLTPAQYGILVHTPNASHGAVPLLLLVLAGLALTIRRFEARIAALVVLGYALVHTGFGLFGGIVVPFAFVAEIVRAQRAGESRARTLAALGLALSVAGIAHFFVGYRPAVAVTDFESSTSHAYLYPRFMALMFANLFGLKGGGVIPSLAGSAFLVVTFGVAARAAIAAIRASASASASERAVHAAILLFVGAAFAFSLGTAIGRASLGLSAAQSSRYVPLLVPGFFGLHLALSAATGSRWRNALGAVWILLLVAGTFPMREREASFMVVLSHDKAIWAETYRATRDIGAADRAAGRRVYPWAPETTRLQEKLDYLEEHQRSLFANPTQP